MADTTDMILPMLREMRTETKEGFERIERRLDAIEAAQSSFRHALSADSLLSKLVTGEFEGRIELLERNVAALQTLTGGKR